MQIDVAINSFIVVLLFIAWGWNFPEDYLSRKMLRPLKGIILYSGLWHGWNMFAPEPLFVNRGLKLRTTSTRERFYSNWN